MNRRILICDDEIHILRAAQIKLTRAGYEVDCAGDGVEGWEKIEANCPDVVVTDCQMPRLDGFGLVQAIRKDERFAHLPVIMLTAKGFEIAHRDAGDRYQILAILAKPFSPRQLLKYVEEILETGGLKAPPVTI